MKWAPFIIGDVFSIRASKSSIDKTKANPGDDCPYITRSDSSNGLSSFVAKGQGGASSLEEGNVITLGLDTSSVFYQPYSFHTGQNVHILTFPCIDKFSALFVVTLLGIQLQKFSWGSNGATLGRLRRTRIMLPINDAGAPDWAFMRLFSERCIPHRIKAQRRGVDRNGVAYAWKPFRIGDLFTVKGGTSKSSKSFSHGKVPLVSSSASRNGISRFVHGDVLCSGFIVVNRNGSVGKAGYHPYGAIVTNDCRILTFKDGVTRSREVALFIVTCITAQKEKYDWGHKLGTKRLRNQRIILPVDAEDCIDYAFMEGFMRTR